MGVFVGVASGISIVKKLEIEKTKILTLEKDNLLLQSITTKLKDNSIQQAFVYDALKMHKDNKITDVQLKNALDNLQETSKKCYFVSYQSYFYSGAQWGPGGSVTTDLKIFKSELLIPENVNMKEIKLKLDEKNEYIIKYYFGPCL